MKFINLNLNRENSFETQLNLQYIKDNLYDKSNHKITKYVVRHRNFYVENPDTNCGDKKKNHKA